MKNLKKASGIFSVLGLSLILFSGCGDESAVAGSQEKSQKTRITFFAAASMTETLSSVAEKYQKEHPDVDIATFRYSSDNNSKIYPAQSINLATLPKGYYVSSIEIAFKRESVQGKFWFNELFGYGAPLSCGEEELLVLTAKQQGLKCQFFPIDIVRHDDITNTINNISKSSMLMGRGAYTYIAHPLSFIARIPLNSFRLKKKYRVPFWHSVKNMLAGVRYYNKHRHDKQSYQ